MATIYDVAKLSKTSAATVSYVLNGRGDEKRISKATQERVLAAAERVSYRPNTTARQLKVSGGRSVRIIVFWPDFYFEQSLVSVMRAINNVSQMSVELPEVSIQFFTPGSLRDIWEKFSPQGYNGILLAGASMEDLEYIAKNKHYTPIVLVNRTCEGFPSVSVDHIKAGRLACDLAYAHGGSSICTIWDSQFHVATGLRQKAFSERCGELGLDLGDSQYTCQGSPEGGYELGINLKQKNLLRRVVYCNNESVARGIATALSESGVKIGQDTQLFTANNGPRSFCRYSTPPLTEINLQMRKVFENALKLCLNIISRNEGGNTVLTLQPVCQFRESMPET